MIKSGKYQHFKGSFYHVLYIGKHSETEEHLVIYHPESDAKDIWVRPLTMFDETIFRDGKNVKRFSFVE
jgi:hypothetical protein